MKASEDIQGNQKLRTGRKKRGYGDEPARLGV